MHSLETRTALVVCLLAAASAHAQLVTSSAVVKGSQEFFKSGSPTYYTGTHPISSYHDIGNHIDAYFGDYTEIVGPKSDGFALYTDAMTMRLKTGDVPILLSNIAFGGNFRLIDGGGPVDSLKAQLGGAANTFAEITEGDSFDPTGLNNVLVASTGESVGFQGIGYKDTSVSTTMTDVILDPHMTYQFSFGIQSQMSLSGYGASFPTPSVTNEFSSSLHDGQGMHVHMNYQALPEPTSMGALGMGALGLLRRRRDWFPVK